MPNSPHPCLASPNLSSLPQTLPVPPCSALGSEPRVYLHQEEAAVHGMLLLSPGDRHNHPEDHDTKMGQPRNENSGWSREESVGKTESREKNLRSSGWFHKRDFREQHSSTRALMGDERARHTEFQQKARAQGESSGQGTAPARRQVGKGGGLAFRALLPRSISPAALGTC